MTVLPEGWRRGLRFWRRTPARDIDLELRFHFEERIAALIAEGASESDARARVEAEFGDIDAVRAGLVVIDRQMAGRERYREWWDEVRADGRYVLRSLARSPGFVITVSLTLALGLGANAAIFSILDRLFFRPPPGVVDPAQVHRIYEYRPPRRGRVASSDERNTNPVFTYIHFRDLRGTMPADIPLAAYRTQDGSTGSGDPGPRVVESFVIGDYFALLGARPAAGRFFTPEELRIETPLSMVVISQRLWQSEFGGSPAVIGQTIDIDGHRREIIGVAAAPFRGPDNNAVDVWMPLNAEEGFKPSDQRWYEGTHSFFIRFLVRTTTPLRLQAAVHAAELVFRHGTVFPDSLAEVRLGNVVEPAMPGFGHSDVDIATRLAGVSLIILLIACANVGNLLLARGMRRRREIAVRLALGVSRRRLMRLLLIEGLLVAFIGAVVALVAAVWGATALRHLLLPDTQWGDGPIDARIVGFTLTLTLVAGAGIALIPALQTTNPDLVPALKAGARDGGSRRSPLRTALLIVQAAFSVFLLAGAGLFVRSLHGVETEPIGYDGDRLIFASVSWNRDVSDHSADVAVRFPDFMAQVRRLPGVEQLATDDMAPMRGIHFEDVHLPGRDSVPRGPSELTTDFVSPDYFRAVGIRQISGRSILATDDAGAPPVVVVNATVARAFWPGDTPLGKCIIVGARDAPCREVVGVVSGTHMAYIVESDPVMQLYLPEAQLPRSGNGVLIIRARPGAVARLIPAIRLATTGIFGSWALPSVHAMSEYLDEQLQPWRVGAALFSAAGLLALVVALIGIYSSVSYIFSQRTHEIGVRMALGAQRGNVLWLVLGTGMKVVLIGIVIGVALSLAAGRLVEAMLYHISPRDPAVLAGAALSLLLVALCGCLIPAWRALRVDPATTLRAE